MQNIEYPSGDNEIVRGVLFTPGNAGKLPTVLFTHGLLSCHKEWGNYPAQLCDQGYVTLAIDLRGHGASAGLRGFISPSRGVEDIRRGLDFLSTLPQVDTSRLALLGHSLGAALSVCATAAEARVKTLIAIAPPASIRQELKLGEATLYAMVGAAGNVYKALTHKSLYLPYRVGINDIFYHESARQAARANDFLQHTAPHETAGTLVQELDTLSCAANVHVPTLIMRGEHDHVVSTTQLVYERLAGPKEFVQVLDSGHSLMMDAHGAEAFETVVNWLAKNL